MSAGELYTAEGGVLFHSALPVCALRPLSVLLVVVGAHSVSTDQARLGPL